MRQQNDTIPPEVLNRNLIRVRSRIAAAAAKVSRKPDDIRLVAVTKYTGIETLRTLIGLGVTDIGESRIQDAEKKYAALGRLATHVQWHLIGHLQTNKADKAVKIFQNIHSVDSPRIAQSLNKEAEKSHRPRLNCLLEVNVAGEANKFGLKPEIAVLSDLLKIATALPHLRIAGLMTMAPFPSPSLSLSDATGETPERVARPVFRRLRELLEEINAKNLYPEPLIELSMGMTQDFEIAIEEGATSIRIGSALLDQ
jgi:pyridoxal phosphate enzyme (YggS family)